MFPAGPARRLLQRFAHSISGALPRPQPAKEDPRPKEELRYVRLPKDFQLHLLPQMTGPDLIVPLSKVDALRYYRQMVALRSLETAAANLYKERFIRGFCHLYSGQEACAVGIRAAMGEQDKLISGYRIHGWAYMMGVSAQGVLAELTGRSTGCSGGKGGSMHMYGKNFFGGTGIVGDQVPLGAGLAFAGKYLKDGSVALALYGDGAANQGQIAETFNMAQLWQLPLVFVCENNNYGMGTSSKRSSSNDKYFKRGDLLPGIRVDGQDVLAVKSATKFAIQHARDKGPLIVELETYRYGGHSMSDPGTSYRTREEVQRIRAERDPIKIFQTLCFQHALISQDELMELNNQVKAEIKAATKAAILDGEPSLPDLWSDVYSGPYEGPLRGAIGDDLEHLRLPKKSTN
ncbi:uncharacterized protein Dana_GF15055 [Drosophila ananassae]|uniref:Pyruvate dehydrogenase E1 component subunit alpha n=1 Tax=Drosophila ananassae TaxID=7217 RepID=B3MM14_DROAN|nr:pyruvate dehydrogenase E1 component subunit alpha, mitochondrial [Drosophila ananassae]EDV30829.1 uncharacterized protein Dana_GF15055 [Drosophila ananassae]